MFGAQTSLSNGDFLSDLLALALSSEICQQGATVFFHCHSLNLIPFLFGLQIQLWIYRIIKN